MICVLNMSLVLIEALIVGTRDRQATAMAKKRCEGEDVDTAIQKEMTWTDEEFSLLANEEQDEWEKLYSEELALERECHARVAKRSRLMREKVLAELADAKAGKAAMAADVKDVAKKKIDAKAGGYTQPQAKKFVPPGSTVTKSVVRTKYWQIRAGYMHPFISRTFDSDITGDSDTSALRYCLNIAWGKYRSSGGEAPCPWDIDIAIF
jgi:hypothetical protein